MKDGPLVSLLKTTPSIAVPPVFLLNKNKETWKMTVAKEEEEHYRLSQVGLGSRGSLLAVVLKVHFAGRNQVGRIAHLLPSHPNSKLKAFRKPALGGLASTKCQEMTVSQRLF